MAKKKKPKVKKPDNPDHKEDFLKVLEMAVKTPAKK
jgi:hypothetical protein